MAIVSLDNEPELLAKIAGGDQLAFKVIYDQYQDRIYKFAFKMMGSREAAEEVLQESMLYFWQMGDKLRKVKHVEGYLKTVAKHKAIDAFRKQALSEKTEAFLAEEYEDSFHLEEEESLLSTGRALLEEGISKLPPKQREVYDLCYRQGLKYEQVAERLQLTHGTVQTHMKLALKFLRGYIKDHPDLLALVVIFRLLEK